MTVRARTARLLAAAAALALGACGGGAAGPSPVPPAPSTASAGPARQAASMAPSSLPATFDAAMVAAAAPGLDPEYVRVLVYTVPGAPVADSGQPRQLERWAGGPFHHCIGEGVPEGPVREAIAAMSAITGIPQTEAGPCNVRWILDATITGGGQTRKSGTAGATTAAVVAFHTPQSVAISAGHEAGHVLGLGHSPHAGDLMVAHDGAAGVGFSADELRVLRLIYGR